MTREHLHYYHMSVSKTKRKKRPYKELPYVSTYFTLSYHNWGRLTHLLLDFGVSGDSDCKKKFGGRSRRVLYIYLGIACYRSFKSIDNVN